MQTLKPLPVLLAFEVIHAGSGRWAIHMQSKLNETADTVNECNQGFGRL